MSENKNTPELPEFINAEPDDMGEGLINMDTGERISWGDLEQPEVTGDWESFGEAYIEAITAAAMDTTEIENLMVCDENGGVKTFISDGKTYAEIIPWATPAAAAVSAIDQILTDIRNAPGKKISLLINRKKGSANFREIDRILAHFPREYLLRMWRVYALREKTDGARRLDRILDVMEAMDDMETIE